MTLQELLDKNRKIRARREALENENKKKKVEPKTEELPCECERVIEEEKIEDEPKVEEPKEKLVIEEAPAEEPKPAPKKAKKPANRQYMVVEDVEKANDAE